MTDHFSWHAIGHSIATMEAFPSLTAVCFVVIRRFAAWRQRGWVAYCAATGVAIPAIVGWAFSDQHVAGIGLAIAGVVTSTWLSLMAAWLRTGLTTATALAQPQPTPAAST